MFFNAFSPPKILKCNKLITTPHVIGNMKNRIFCYEKTMETLKTRKNVFKTQCFNTFLCDFVFKLRSKSCFYAVSQRSRYTIAARIFRKFILFYRPTTWMANRLSVPDLPGRKLTEKQASATYFHSFHYKKRVHIKIYSYPSIWPPRGGQLRNLL